MVVTEAAHALDVMDGDLSDDGIRRAGIRIGTVFVHQPSTHRIVQDVPHHPFAILCSAHHMIVEPGLPESAGIAEGPALVGREPLERADELTEGVIVSTELEEEMEVVGHGRSIAHVAT